MPSLCIHAHLRLTEVIHTVATNRQAMCSRMSLQEKGRTHFSENGCVPEQEGSKSRSPVPRSFLSAMQLNSADRIVVVVNIDYIFILNDSTSVFAHMRFCTFKQGMRL